MTQHEANNSLIWVSDRLWSSLTAEQKQWVQGAADEVGQVQPGKALELEHQSEVKLKSIGVQAIVDVDKSGFIKIAQPHLDRLSKELGPHAVKVAQLIRAIQ
jgi:TRAP-type C4-dicarboxylate transport system substrate-binding protein